MTKLVTFLVVGVVGLAVLVSAGPTLVALAHAAVPLVVATGCVVVVGRVVWYLTRRY